jgi:hypothetical protein
VTAAVMHKLRKTVGTKQFGNARTVRTEVSINQYTRLHGRKVP